MIEIVGCLHVAVMVSNLDRSIEFYTNMLGLARIDRQLKYPGAWYQIGDFQLHLIENIDVPANDKIALAVRDLDAAKQQLITANYIVKMSNSGRAALFTQDPDGNAIELTLVNAGE
jgi:glyoxylase I family protein